MKGLTLLWMCLCCLRPEDVANVLPHSEQAWARAPTCCERMCLWRLLGSVNTCWGEEPHRHTGGLLSASKKMCGGDTCTQISASQIMKCSLQQSSLYLWAVFTFVVLATIVRHLMSDQVRFPVEGLGTLVTLIFSLLTVGQAVGLQAAEKRKEKKTMRMEGFVWYHMSVCQHLLE